MGDVGGGFLARMAGVLKVREQVVSEGGCAEPP